MRWEWIFFANVFMACVSFSIVLPSLWLYLSALDGSQEFYAWVVAAFSIGEAIGSIALGALSNWAGTKPTLRLCCVLAISGAAMYSLASFAFEHVSAPAAPYIVFVGRLLQGIGSGGQQAVEQSYLSIAAPPSQRTELTSKLSTFACLGFIFGPAVGALVATMPTFSVGALHFDAYTMQGWCIVAMNLVMFADLELFVDVSGAPEARKTQGGGGGDGETAAPWQSTPTKAAAGLGTPTTRMQTEAAAGGGAVLWEVWACILFFFVHFNGFAVQETITTPLVQDWFGWGEMHANLLFTGAGAANLLMAVLMAALTAPRAGGGGQLVEDRVLLVISLVLSVAGWVLMVPPDAVGGPPMGLPQFFVAFALVTVSFPVGRGVCLAMVGKLLGKQPQGGWMGLMFAFGSVARMAGPFWAVHGFSPWGPRCSRLNRHYCPRSRSPPRGRSGSGSPRPTASLRHRRPAAARACRGSHRRASRRCRRPRSASTPATRHRRCRARCSPRSRNAREIIRLEPGKGRIRRKIPVRPRTVI